MRWLKQSTAVTIKFGPFVDDTDGKTAETALTIKKADVRLSKNGGTMAAASADQGSGDAGAAHNELGYYDVSLNTTDTGTLGHLRVMVHESGALPVWDDFQVLPANTWDSLVGGTDYLDAAIADMTATAVDTILDEVVEPADAGGENISLTMRQALALAAALVGAQTDGGGTATLHIRNVNDTVNRVTITADSSGRSAITLDFSDL